MMAYGRYPVSLEGITRLAGTEAWIVDNWGTRA